MCRPPVKDWVLLSPWSKLSFLLEEPSPSPSMATRSLFTSESFRALSVTSTGAGEEEEREEEGEEEEETWCNVTGAVVSPNNPCVCCHFYHVKWF